MNRRWLLLMVPVLVLLVWQAGRWATQVHLASGAARAETTLMLTVKALSSHLARYEVTPGLLAAQDPIRQLVASPRDPGRVATINALLDAQARQLGASDIYIMDPSGLTVAASNHARPDSFVGANFSYRPYFSQAIRGSPTRFYALGTTSGQRGYYFSAPVRAPEGPIAGVIAVKIEIDSIEQSWQGQQDTVFVTDPEGIIFMTSDPGLRYGGILPLTPARLARTEASRRYSDAPLHGLDWQAQPRGGVTLARIGDGAEHLAVVQTMPEAGWTVHVLVSTAGARAEAALLTAALALLLCLGGAGAVVLRQRQAQARERRALRDQAKADLELRVAQRTAALAATNTLLEQEISERRATEAALRAAQDNLVRLGKLAALGQMSATLSHEINQPLAAARNYADSAAVLLDRGDLPRARDNIVLILGLIDRIRAIGQHLRQAARPAHDPREPVDLPTLLAETQVIMAARLAACGARLDLDLPAALPPVLAGTTRLQQVLVNLVSNACDALDQAEDRRISVTARVEGATLSLSVRDRGPGVPPALAERIFDPFVTGTSQGTGLGLGLSISAAIMGDFGGTLTLGDAGPGAVFILTLPLAPASFEAA